MNYPFWDPGVSYGLLMAAIAVVHVFISHFAVGGGLYLVVTERRARARGDEPVLAYLRRLSRFFILVTVVSGALTGVGIWFIIGLLNPGATEVLIRTFVWGWAIEWTFFFTEIAAALLYYYGWDRMSPRGHLAVGWIYFAAAWLSLFIINGIITFMLTPGEWIKTGNFWDGFFNPTYGPSLALRTGIVLVMAGLFALWMAARDRGLPAASRRGLIRHNAGWALAGLVVAAASALPYLRAIPADLLKTAEVGMTIPPAAQSIMLISAGALVAIVLLAGVLVPALCRPPVVLLALAAAFLAFGGFEWYREALRKPYAITGYAYANGLLVMKADEYKKDGLLKHVVRTGNDGADLYRRACGSCHTRAGYNALAPALDHLDRDLIVGLVRGQHLLPGRMPPFLGTREEAGLIADFLQGWADPRPLAEATGLKGAELGREVYRRRCEICHTAGTRRDIAKSLRGLGAEKDFRDLVDNAADMDDLMPAFTGSDAERQALVQYMTATFAKETRP